MEDKELQQLIEAKLWQLENQRQQEKIASRIGRNKIVWPWWLGTAAAAALLAAVLLTPLLFSGKEEFVAKAENPELLENLENPDNLEPPTHPETHTATTPVKPLTSAPVAATDTAPASTPFIEPEPVADDTLISIPAAPRVHTRRSNRLGDIKKAPEKPKVPALIAHYIDIPDTVLFTSNIVINLK